MLLALPPPPAVVVSVNYAAPSSGECPTLAEVELVFARKGMRLSAASPSHVGLEVARKNGRFEMRVQYTDASRGVESRTLRDDGCAALLHGATSLVAVWSGIPSGSSASPETPSPAPPLLPASLPPTPERLVARAWSARTTAWTHGGAWGPSLELAQGVGLGADAAPQLWFGLGGGSVQIAGGRLLQMYVPLRVCAPPWPLGEVRVGACARAEGGLMWSRGDASARNELHARPWLAVGAELSASVMLSRRLSLGAWGGAMWLPVQDAYTIDGAAVHGPVSWAARTGLELSVRTDALGAPPRKKE